MVSNDVAFVNVGCRFLVVCSKAIKKYEVCGLKQVCAREFLTLKYGHYVARAASLSESILNCRAHFTLKNIRIPQALGHKELAT